MPVEPTNSCLNLHPDGNESTLSLDVKTLVIAQPNDRICWWKFLWKNNLLKALIELESTVKAMPTANPKPNPNAAFQLADELTRQMPHDTDPALLHYLHKKSYEKARLYLQGRDAENQAGNCRHV